MSAVTVDFGLDLLPSEELHAVLADLREAHRVAPVRFFGTEAVLVTRFDDVKEAFRDDEHLPGGATYQMHTEPVIGRTFISMDGTEHDRHRQLATPAFRSRAVAQFDEEALVPLAHEIVDRFVARGEADLVAEFTTVLPFYAITRKLGVPRGTDDEMRTWADRMLTYPSDPEGAVGAARAFSDVLEPLLDARRAAPEEDLLSALLAAEVDGEALDREEVCSTVRLMFSVGATTTSHALGNMLSALLDRPELLERARADEPLRAGIVHELLRWDGPLATLPRLAPLGAQFGDETFPPGTLLLFGIASANRDPSVWDDPARFDPTRDPQEIVTFGFGQKFCPGSHLARRQLLTALGVLLDRLPGLRLADPHGATPVGGVLRHPTALHVVWDLK
ncbi:MAG: cytochrome P450 [Acidimicrobiia bacterium]|nr:cytochrome P450 [Acidimicrobiia bacterium]